MHCPQLYWLFDWFDDDIRLCKVKLLFLYCNSRQIDLAIVEHALIYISSFYKEVIIKAFSSIFDVLHCPLYDAFLILIYKKMQMMFQFQEMAVGLWIPCATICWCLSYSFIISDRKRSATNIFRSFDMLIARICLVSGSIVATHQSQMYSEPTLSWVSSF